MMQCGPVFGNTSWITIAQCNHKKSIVEDIIEPMADYPRKQQRISNYAKLGQLNARIFFLFTLQNSQRDRSVSPY